MLHLGVLVLVMFAGVAFAQDGVSVLDRAEIRIINRGDAIPRTSLGFEAGDVSGNVLNLHYYPGLHYYGAGRYVEAERQMSYIIANPRVIEREPRRAEFMSMAHYIRGMVYLYHATGIGRHRLARADFEAALQWNPQNHAAYLELSRVFSQLGLKQAAVSVLEHLLNLKPDSPIAEEARREIVQLGAGQGQDADPASSRLQ